MCNYGVFQPEITKNYGLNEWREDLKAVLVESGGKNRPTIFLFAEGQVKEEYFLQDIDALLNSGEVPNLFTLDEQQNVLEVRLPFDTYLFCTILLTFSPRLIYLCRWLD